MEAKACGTVSKNMEEKKKAGDVRGCRCRTRALHLDVAVAVISILFFLAVIILLIGDG